MKAHECNIQALIMDWLIWDKQHKLVVPNSTGVLTFSENDILSVTKSDYTHEYEIKRSKSDYKADFKKSKHHWFKTKDYHFRTGRVYSPNYFWFITYRFSIQPPEYAGWISVTHKDTNYLEFTVEKKAPLLHKSKIIQSQKDQIAHMLSRRITSAYRRFYLQDKKFE